MLTTIEKFRTVEAIARELKIPQSKVSEVLAFLSNVDLVKKERGIFLPGVSRIFLGNDSPMITRHHSNWRLRAMESFDRNPLDDIHLSTLLSFAAKDLLRMKERIVKNIEETRAISRESSPEEELYCFAVDFFKV